MPDECQVKILDCTLRDGGYYNNWHFPEALVEHYLMSVAKAQIDYVELGLRQFNSEEWRGGVNYACKQTFFARN